MFEFKEVDDDKCNVREGSSFALFACSEQDGTDDPADDEFRL